MPKTIAPHRVRVIVEAIRTDMGKLKRLHVGKLRHYTDVANTCIICGRKDDYSGSYENRPGCTDYTEGLGIRSFVLLYEELIRIAKRQNSNRDRPRHVNTRKPDWREEGADGAFYCAVCGEPRDGGSGECDGPRLTEPHWPEMS